MLVLSTLKPVRIDFFFLSKEKSIEHGNNKHQENETENTSSKSITRICQRAPPSLVDSEFDGTCKESIRRAPSPFA
jgi:hypothetical protein